MERGPGRDLFAFPLFFECLQAVNKSGQRRDGFQPVNAAGKEFGEFLGDCLRDALPFVQQHSFLCADIIGAEPDIHRKQSENADTDEKKCLLLEVHRSYFLSSTVAMFTVALASTSTGIDTGFAFSCQTLIVYFPGGTSLSTKRPSFSVFANKVFR
jgi:hypothetical protein